MFIIINTTGVVLPQYIKSNNPRSLGEFALQLDLNPDIHHGFYSGLSQSGF